LKRPAGLEAIILYKLFKSVGMAMLAALLVVLLMRGAEAGAATLAQVLLDHVTGAWALDAATLIVITGTTGHVKLAAAGAFADATLSAVEGLALRAGRWWAPWLVVIATGALLPWELFEIVRKPSWLRVVILVLNVAVIVYLLRTVVREHRGRAADRVVDS
jgi:uncharacterized membrane protein (DUF2068 family)